MKSIHRWVAPALLFAILLLSACAGAVSDEEVFHDPAEIEQVKGTDLSRITLTGEAAERLGIRTAAVEANGRRSVVPTATTIVDPEGQFWVYTAPEPLVFLRHKITIDEEVGTRAFLKSGPPVGTKVVSVGAAELYGVEFGVGH